MKADEPWIIDTVCSVHMTGNHDLLREIEQLINIVEVVTALPKPNRAFSNYIGSSDILTTLDGITPKRMVLTNVMYVAGMKKNLISAHQCCTNGREWHFGSKTGRLTDANGEVLARCYWVNNNFYLLQIRYVDCNYISTKNNILLWHRRLKHRNFKDIHRMAKDHPEIGIKDTSKNPIEKCRTCMITN